MAESNEFINITVSGDSISPISFLLADQHGGRYSLPIRENVKYPIPAGHRFFCISMVTAEKVECEVEING